MTIFYAAMQSGFDGIIRNYDLYAKRKKYGQDLRD